jgi:AcrR family transcriptional regulator
VSLVPSPVKKRAYDSTGRQEAARARRRRILRTAQELFVAQGYAGTTLAQVARGAAVSEDLLFRSFRTKRGLLKEVMDVAIGGDDEDLPLLQRADPQAMRATTDQHEQLRMFAAGITGQMERLRPLNDMMRSAAAVEPEIAALRDDLNLRQRRTAMDTVAGWVAANGPLRDGLTVEEAGAVLWTLAGPDVHRALRVDCGWAPERYNDWLRDVLVASLLPATSTGTRARTRRTPTPPVER